MRSLSLGRKSVAALAIVVMALVVFGRYLQCPAGNYNGGVVQAPPDSTYMPVLRRHYTPPPPLIGGLTNRRSAAPLKRLPKGVSEADVQRVVKIKVRDSNTINVIELRDGGVLVEKDSVIEAVEVIEYNKPALSFGLFPGVGITGLIKDGSARISPMLKLSFVEILGTVRLPMVAVDSEGFGAGLETRLYHDLFIGAGIFTSYSNLDHRQFKATLEYNL